MRCENLNASLNLRNNIKITIGKCNYKNKTVALQECLTRTPTRHRVNCALYSMSLH